MPLKKELSRAHDHSREVMFNYLLARLRGLDEEAASLAAGSTKNAIAIYKSTYPEFREQVDALRDGIIMAAQRQAMDLLPKGFAWAKQILEMQLDADPKQAAWIAQAKTKAFELLLRASGTLDFKRPNPPPAFLQNRGPVQVTVVTGVDRPYELKEPLPLDGEFTEVEPPQT